MTEREQIINRAKQLILQHPTWGKDRVNIELRKQYGVGLRRIEVAKLKKQTTAQAPTLSYQQTLRTYREKTLQKEGFLPEEARWFAKYPISHAGLEKLRRFRKTELKKAHKAGIPRQRIERYIRDSYVAHDWVDVDKTIRPDFWNKHAFDEILKKPQERTSVLIQPENYQYFRRTIQAKFKPEEVLQMTQLIPTGQWAKRMADYQILRKAYFTHFEAFTIITGTARDVNRKLILQDLDLNNPLWQQSMQARIDWVKTELSRLHKQGLSPYKAKQAIIKELQRHDASGKDKTTPYDFLRDYYKYVKKGATVDFVQAKQKRDFRLRKKKLPYRVR